MHIDCFQPSDEYSNIKYKQAVYDISSLHKNNISSNIKSESICDIVNDIIQNIYSMRFLLLPSIGNKE